MNTLSWIKDLESNFSNKKMCDFSLDNMKTALEILGNPHNKLKNVIHITGTNGKGSTTTFVWNILKNSGYKVHKYTSPHLLKFNERITIYDRQISDFELGKFSDICKQKISHLNLTFFEITTIIAFLAFVENKADFVVLETGLGGIFDATNVFSEKLCAIITSISLDHQGILGVTLEEIAKNKIPIMQSAKFSILAQNIDKIAKIDEKYQIYGRNFNAHGNFDNLEYKNHDFNYKISNIHSGIFGNHQMENASLAITTVLNIKNLGYNNITKETIKNGIKTAYIAGRIQKMSNKTVQKILPNSKKCEIYLDISHNQDSIAKLVDFISYYYEKSNKIGVFSILKDKNCEEIYKIIEKANFSKIYILPINNPRTENVEIISQNLREYSNIEGKVFANQATLFNHLSLQNLDNTAIFFFGSNYFIAEVVEYIEDLK